MPVQTQARAQLARLRTRLQPANAASWLDQKLDQALDLLHIGGGSNPASAGDAGTAAQQPKAPAVATQPSGAPSPGALTAELAPGQITRAEQIKLVRAWPLDKVRDLARGQIQRTKDAFEAASDVPWYTGIYLRWVNHVRWGPSLKMIDDAEESYAHAQERASDAEKKESYISAWTTARLALSAIAKEAKFGETSYQYLAEDLGRAAVDAAEPYVKQAGQGLELALYGLLAFGLLQVVGK